MAISEQQATSPYAGRRMTLEEFLRLPAQEPALEFEDGMVTQKVSPKRFHGRGQFKLGQELARAGEDTGLGQVFTETRFKTSGWAPVPDISFYLMERIAPLPDDLDDDFDVPPDIAVEVSSPDQSVGELVRKCLRYAALGVPISLLVAIEDRTVFVFRPGQQTLALRGADTIDLSDVLPAFDLTVDGLFAMIRPERPRPNS